MIRAFRPEPEASAELEDAALWYESQRPGLGEEFLQAVDATLQRIAQWPKIGRQVPDLPDDVPARKAPMNRWAPSG
jgi:plasmid stabilization system protein ParE